MNVVQNEVKSMGPGGALGGTLGGPLGGSLTLVPASAMQIAMPTPPRVPWMQRVEAHPSWPVLAEVPETLAAYIPLTHFTVRRLLELEEGDVIGSGVLTSDLIPVKIGSVRLLWGEFEMIDHHLALRVTQLA